ncbi:MAG TPA: M20/M25/M40 family metallo-hydrolase [Gemmatirosa sp.]
MPRLTRRVLAAALVLAARAAAAQTAAAQTAVAPADSTRYQSYQPAADRIVAAALADSTAWRRVAELTDTYGPRLSGSDALERAIDRMLAMLRADGLAHVRGEPVMVPHWVRGDERAELVVHDAAGTVTRRKPLHILALGGSVGTPVAGISAPVLVVTSFDDLTRRAADARGRVVLFDVPFTTYDETVRYRALGASAAARVGAVAALVRSVTPNSIDSPHTGAMRYDSTAPRIPAVAVTVEDAELMHRLQDRGLTPTVSLRLGAQTLPDAPSRNIVAELVGRERPGEVVVLGGHLDSWDVGQGAMDDLGGFVAAWEAVRLLKRLGLTPRRTVRVVGWTNEENGGRGGRGYLAAHRAELADHVFAMESDNGVFRPSGMRLVGTPAAVEQVAPVGRLLRALGAGAATAGEGEADIDPLLAAGVPGAALDVDGSRYFWYHHTNADTPDKLDPADVARCVATFAVWAYVLADAPDRPPHGVAPSGR